MSRDAAVRSLVGGARVLVDSHPAEGYLELAIEGDLVARRWTMIAEQVIRVGPRDVGSAKCSLGHLDRPECA